MHTVTCRRLAIIIIAILSSVSLSFAAHPHAYVVNSVGETLSRIDLTSSVVTNNIVTLGSDVSSAPNQIIIYGDKGYVTNSLTAEIQVIDLAAASTQNFWPMPQGSNPYWMAVYDDTTLFVSLTLGNAIARVDLRNGAILATDSIGISPQQLLIHNHLLYVSNTALDYNSFVYGQGSVAVWDIRGDSLVTTINVGTNPQQLAVDNDERIHVICTGNYFDQFGIVYVIDPATKLVTDSLSLGGSPGGLVISDDNRGWIAAGGFSTNGEIYAYDAGTLAIQHDVSNPVTTGLGCTAIEPWNNNSVLAVTFANTVEHFDQSFSQLSVYAVGSGPSSVAIDYLPGDMDGSWSIDIADLSLLVDNLFLSFTPLPYPSWRGDVDGQLGVDIGDLTALVDNLFGSFAPLKPGRPWERY